MPNKQLTLLSNKDNFRGCSIIDVSPSSFHQKKEKKKKERPVTCSWISGLKIW